MASQHDPKLRISVADSHDAKQAMFMAPPQHFAPIEPAYTHQYPHHQQQQHQQQPYAHPQPLYHHQQHQQQQQQQQQLQRVSSSSFLPPQQQSMESKFAAPQSHHPRQLRERANSQTQQHQHHHHQQQQHGQFHNQNQFAQQHQYQQQQQHQQQQQQQQQQHQHGVYGMGFDPNQANNNNGNPLFFNTYQLPRSSSNEHHFLLHSSSGTNIFGNNNHSNLPHSHSQSHPHSSTSGYPYPYSAYPSALAPALDPMSMTTSSSSSPFYHYQLDSPLQAPNHRGSNNNLNLFASTNYSYSSSHPLQLNLMANEADELDEEFWSSHQRPEKEEQERRDREAKHLAVRYSYAVPIAAQSGREFFGAKRFRRARDDGGEFVSSHKFQLTPWRVKDRMKTLHAALVMCLNIGVDPPDVAPRVVSGPRLQCWMDPLSIKETPKALEKIGNLLQTQYERWQPKAVYKQCLDPTHSHVKKLCLQLRKEAGGDRVLFHYNGHGVPRPTANGELWVFNRNFTQYIPLSVYDLDTWLGSPSLLLLDCSAAGLIIEAYQHILSAPQNEADEKSPAPAGSSSSSSSSASSSPSRPSPSRDIIMLAACAADETLPAVRAELPADLFTACLTTPVKTAIRWFAANSSFYKFTSEELDKLPGRTHDRKTALGEINWIFTAITDTIAWDILPKDVFHQLFRQDLLVASLFRNFLLAQRIFKAHGRTPLSWPALPSAHKHPMWEAWDLALEGYLLQLDKFLTHGVKFKPSNFFAEHLAAFQVWLEVGSEESGPPLQLPIVLQVLLNQNHRKRALVLLAKFLGKGCWAVHQALSVGIFPYVVKLLQPPTPPELREVLVFIWAKIFSLDRSCAVDLVNLKEPASSSASYHTYFLCHLAAQDVPARQKAMSAFVLSALCDGYPIGQYRILRSDALSLIHSLLSNCESTLLKRWLCLLLAKLWQDYDDAKTMGVRVGLTDLLCCLLCDPSAEVRASALYALSTFMASSGEENPRWQIELAIAKHVLQSVADGSPLVREEMLICLAQLVHSQQDEFGNLSIHKLLSSEESFKTIGAAGRSGSPPVSLAKNTFHPASSPPRSSSALSASASSSSTHHPSSTSTASSSSSSSSHTAHPSPSPATSNSNLGLLNGVQGFGGGGAAASQQQHDDSLSPEAQRELVWKVVLSSCRDPFPPVAKIARSLRSFILMLLGEEAEGAAVPQAGRATPYVSSQSRSSNVNARTRPEESRVEKLVPSFRSLALFKGKGERARSNSTETPSSTSSSLSSRTSQSSNQSSNPSNPSASASNTNTSGGGGSGQIHVTSSSHSSSSNASSGGSGGGGGGGSSGSLAESSETKSSVPASTIYQRSCEYFIQPMNDPIDQETPLESVLLSQWRQSRIQAVYDYAKTLKQDDLYRSSEFAGFDQSAVISSHFEQVSKCVFHPYDNVLIAADGRRQIGVWDPKEVEQLNRFAHDERGSSSSRLSALTLLNTHHTPLLLTAADDGVVKFWKNFHVKDCQEIVTAFSAVRGLPKGGSGLVCDWQQSTGRLLAGGALDSIRIWDCDAELCVGEFPTHANHTASGHAAPLTTMVSGSSGSVVYAGFGDGGINVYDLRTQNILVASLRKHSRRVVRVHLQHPGEDEHRLISGSISADVVQWDLRSHAPLSSLVAFDNSPLDAMAVHPAAPLLAVGSSKQVIKIFDLGGTLINTIKHHKGFMGHRIGPISSLEFHPHKLLLSAGAKNAFISILAAAKD